MDREQCYHKIHPDTIVKGLKYFASEIEEYVLDSINNILEDNEIDIDIVSVYMHGSRIFGNPRQDSDIDIVLFYNGDYPEDGLFNIINDEIGDISGFQIDVNPKEIYRGRNSEEFILIYIKLHDNLNETLLIWKINENNTLNEIAQYALADNAGKYSDAFSFEVMPWNTNLSLKGNDIQGIANNHDSFKVFVGDIVKGKSPIDDEVHKGLVKYLYYSEDSNTPTYLYILEFENNTIIPVYPKDLIRCRTIPKDEYLEQVTDMVPRSPTVY